MRRILRLGALLTCLGVGLYLLGFLLIAEVTARVLPSQGTIQPGTIQPPKGSLDYPYLFAFPCQYFPEIVEILDRQKWTPDSWWINGVDETVCGVSAWPPGMGPSE